LFLEAHFSLPYRQLCAFLEDEWMFSRLPDFACFVARLGPRFAAD
jgi:hypothetical protein